MYKKCKSCKNCVVEEYGPGIAAGIRVMECRAFMRSDRFGEVSRLTCEYAYPEFCNGVMYRPNLMTRIRKFFFD